MSFKENEGEEGKKRREKERSPSAHAPPAEHLSLHAEVFSSSILWECYSLPRKMITPAVDNNITFTTRRWTRCVELINQAAYYSFRRSSRTWCLTTWCDMSTSTHPHRVLHNILPVSFHYKRRNVIIIIPARMQRISNVGGGVGVRESMRAIRY